MAWEWSVPQARSRGSTTAQTAANPEEFQPRTPELEEDSRVLPTVPEYLNRGLDLKRWWTEIERQGGPQVRFPLERSFNRATRSFGFYGEAPVGGATMPVMGNVQEMFYDQTTGPGAHELPTAEWTAAQIREFVLKYFMRISSFRQPEVFVAASQPVAPPALSRLSWCPTERENQVGFGFKQLFYKKPASAQVHVFPTYDQFVIVDQREIGRLYEWLVLKVRIFDFNFRSRPFGNTGPELAFNLNEQSYLVIHKDFINDKERPLPGVLGDFGIGYSFIKNPTRGPFGYGPGEFDAALELINFRVYETGYISVRMVFISNRPSNVTNVLINPIGWSFSLADLFSFGVITPWLRAARRLFEQLPLQFRIDPVLSYVYAANALTGGYAAQTLCISLEQLEKAFLAQHFRQHYETVLGSLATWRRFPDWLDENSLPVWVKSGIGS
jgi:hypothetical protein